MLGLSDQKKSGMKIQCPNCSKAALKLTDQTEDIRELLPRWESEGQFRFSKQTIQEYSDKTSITLYQCPACSFKQFHPIIEGTPQFYHDITKNQYYVKDKWEFGQAIKDIKRFKVESVLDVGCGEGAFLSQLRQQLPAVSLYGFDHNESVREKLAQLNISYVSNLMDLGLKFDVICSFQAIEHFADPFIWLEIVKRSLKPDGCLIVTVPDSAGPLRFFSEAVTDLPPHHLTRWNKESVRIFLERRGLELLRVKEEPLPDYLWDAYLPKIIESNMPNSMYKFCESKRLIEKVFRFLKRINRMGVKHLPIHGHTLYVTARLQG